MVQVAWVVLLFGASGGSGVAVWLCLGGVRWGEWLYFGGRRVAWRWLFRGVGWFGAAVLLCAFGAGLALVSETTCDRPDASVHSRFCW